MDETNPTPWGAMMGAANDAGGNEPDGTSTQTSADVTSADIAGPSPVLQQQITPDMVAAGYQPGMATQNITIGDEGKGPKVPMIIAAVLVVIGLIGFGTGIAAGASLEDTFNKLSTVDYTMSIGDSGELTHDDEDGLGEEGWYLLIPGDVKADENNNGILDKNFLGIPKEGYGFSTNPFVFGTPDFDDAKFELNSDKSIDIEMIY